MQRTTRNDLWTCFLEFKFLSQSEDFAWAIAFACMMADFQNAVASRIFSVSSSGFLHRTILNDLKNGF